MNKFVGAHISSAGGVENAPINALKIEAKAFALFTKNQRQWVAKSLTTENCKLFKENLAKAQIQTKHVLPHDSYLINLGNPDPEKREKSYLAFIDEIERCNQLGLQLLNFHPGSHLKEISEEQCLDLIAKNLNRAIKETKNITLVIENTAGQGSNLGYKFEHLGYIIEQISNKERVGVCLDTCHTFTAGYDLRDDQAYSNTMNNFNSIVGLEYLRGMHLNDSKPDLGSKKDRHESLGKGKIGLNCFQNIMNDSNMDDIPLVLETVDSSLWPKEIKLLYSFIK